MAKNLPLAALAVFLLFSGACTRESFKASEPVYLAIPAIALRTDPVGEGTAHSRITTAWIFANGKAVGTFELPATVPVLAEGMTRLEVYPGITMNGINATRAIYTPFTVINETVDLTPLDTSYLVADSIPVVRYTDQAVISLLEDFDQAGLNLSSTPGSDTAILKTEDPREVFINPQQPENNGKAGKIVLAGNTTFFEVATTESYDLPPSGQSVYLEMTYHTNIPFSVGVIANTPLGDVPARTLIVFPTEDWNKIYVNLVTELTAYPQATGYQIFMGGSLPSDTDTARVYLDNLKLVY